jgi:UDP-N-acetyl-D-mannosaminuronic acid dehydrogenase
MQKICVIGLGYIGLPTASLLAVKGFKVHGIDVRQDVVDQLNQGRVHIVEPGLDILIKSAVHSGNFKASLQIESADIFIIAVPTPFKENYDPDLSYVKAASESIAPFIQEGNLIILESTSPVGTTEKIKEWISAINPKVENIHYAHCPERVIPGRVLQEIVENDRVVGGVDAQSTEKAANFYRNFVEGNVLTTDARTAEMCKLTENSFRDVNIAFANELSIICDKLNINVWVMIRLANQHPRVKILQPGPGVGGHCIAVDPWFIVAAAPEQSRLLKTAREVNDSKPHFVIDQVKEALTHLPENATVACLGLAFKADIDDLRESPALEIAKELKQILKDRLIVCEPNVKVNIDQFKNVSLDEALKAEFLVILVDHKEFKALPKSAFANKVIVDTRGIVS